MSRPITHTAGVCFTRSERCTIGSDVFVYIAKICDVNVYLLQICFQIHAQLFIQRGESYLDVFRFGIYRFRIFATKKRTLNNRMFVCYNKHKRIHTYARYNGMEYNQTLADYSCINVYFASCSVQNDMAATRFESTALDTQVRKCEL